MAIFTDKQLGAMKDPHDWIDLYAKAKCMKNDEKSVMLQLQLMLICGDLEKLFAVPKVERHRFELNVGVGRVDLALFHKDGSISLIEAKAEHDQMKIAAGIGQVCMYASALSTRIKKGNGAYPVIRRFLCAYINPEKSLDLLAACEMAGVKFVHLASYKLFKSQVDAIDLKYEPATQ